MPLGAPWGSERPAREVLNHLGDGLVVTLGSAGGVFHDILQKSVICSFRCHSRTEVLLEQVQAPKLEPFCYKSLKSCAKAPYNCLEGQCQSGQDSQGWPVGSVLL